MPPQPTQEPSLRSPNVVSVRDVVRGPGGLVSVHLVFSDGTTRRMILPGRLATFDNVTFSAAAVAMLVELPGDVV